MARRGRVGRSHYHMRAHIITCGGLFFGGNMRARSPGRSVSVRAFDRSPAGGDWRRVGTREGSEGPETRRGRGRGRGSRLRGTCRHVRRREHAHHPRGAAFFLGVGAAGRGPRAGGQAGRRAGRRCPATPGKRAPRAVLWPVASIATCRLPYP